MKLPENMTQILKQVLNKRGIVCLMGTDACKSWKRNHGNCFGCKSENACSKLTAWYRATATGQQPPKEFLPDNSLEFLE